jgi:hypothetical protein
LSSVITLTHGVHLSFHRVHPQGISARLVDLFCLFITLRRVRCRCSEQQRTQRLPPDTLPGGRLILSMSTRASNQSLSFSCVVSRFDSHTCRWLSQRGRQTCNRLGTPSADTDFLPRRSESRSRHIRLRRRRGTQTRRVCDSCSGPAFVNNLSWSCFASANLCTCILSPRGSMTAALR